MAFFSYLDCSGDPDDPNVIAISVGGLVGHESKWKLFEEKWPLILREFNVAELHMKHFAHSVKGSDFETWKNEEGKRRQFISSLTSLINECGFQAAGATMVLSAYRTCNQYFYLEEAFRSPYAMASMLAAGVIIDWHTRQQSPEPLLVILEHGDNSQSTLVDMLGQFKRDENDHPLVTLPIFQRKKWTDPDGNVQYCFPLQAADFMCYEQAKAMTDLLLLGKRDMRKSFLGVESLYEENCQRMWRLMDTAQMMNVVKNFKVRPRLRIARGTSEDQG